MVKMNGVTSLFDGRDFGSLKHKALLFDTLYLSEFRTADGNLSHYPDHIRADVEYLQERGIVAPPPDPYNSYIIAVNNDHPIRTITDCFCDDPACQHRRLLEGMVDVSRSIDDTVIRLWTAWIASRDVACRYVPACRNTLTVLKRPVPSQQITVASRDVLNIILDQLPAPSEDTPWESILDFRSEMRDKLWDLRRFVKEVATKRQSIAEVKDDIEYSLHQYEEAMKLHKIKRTNSFIEVFLIAPFEILENLATLKFSQVGKSILSIRKRKIDLIEAEMKLPGHECAYVFKAQEQFGQNNQ
jgi:hypothetical protein